jgi:hypothetical protein
MKSKEFEALAKRYLLPSLPSFGVRGGLLFRKPRDDLLVGFRFEGSDFDKSQFALWGFVQPLYVPERGIVFTFGKRLGGRPEFWWRISETNGEQVMSDVLSVATTDGLQLLEQVRTPRDFVDRAPYLVSDQSNLHLRRAQAFSLARAGDLSSARQRLEDFVRDANALGASLPWSRDLAEQGKLLLHAIRNGSKEPQQLLDRWRQETLQSLGLSESGSRFPLSSG